MMSSNSRLHADEDLFHAPAFQLEHAVRVPLESSCRSSRSSRGDVGDVDLDAPALFDELQGIANDGERLEAEEVEFRETDGGEIVHGKLRDGHRIGALAQGNISLRGACRR